MKILVVDDCHTTRKLLSFYLKSSGFDVVLAENGLDAIEKLGMETVNIVLTDLNMPYMDGLEFVRAVRSDPAHEGLPIVMVTTEADPDEREKAMAVGATAYMVKPVTSEMVSDLIKNIMKDIFKKGGATGV